MKYIITLLLSLVFSATYAQEPGAGYALNFDGTNDIANAHAADLAAINDNFTIEFWVNPTETRDFKTENNTGITGTIGNGQRYAVFPIQAGVNASAGVSVGTNGVSVYEHGNSYMPALLVYDTPITGWNHIAVVYTNKQPSLYINGILVRTGLTSLKSIVYPSAQLGGGNHGYFKGEIDEFRVWSTSRTETELREHMCKKLVGNETGLARYLRIDEGTGNTVKDETGNNNATLTSMDSATDWVYSGAALGNTSVYGYAPPLSLKALNFDGVNDRVNGYSNDLTTVTNNFTIEMWVSPTNTINTSPNANGTGITGITDQRYVVYPQHGNATSVNGDAGAGISVGTNGILVFEHDGGYLPCMAKYVGAITGWNHIAVVYNNRVPTIYLNGVAVSTGVASPSRTAVFPGGLIGGGGYGHFNGDIDEVRIWNVARSASEIATNYNNELTAPFTNLVRYYMFNTGSGNVAIDATGTFNASLVNMNNSSSWVVDGWLSGDPTYFTGSLTLQSPEMDNLEVSNVTGNTQGFHIYHVEAVPNSIAGIDGLGTNDHYYGVFKAGEVTYTEYTATYFYEENDAWQSSINFIDEIDLALFSRSDNTVTNWGNTGAYINTYNKSLIATANSTEFILGATGGVALPIELISFEATLNDANMVNVTWQTASELNNDYFTIEKSVNNTEWEVVGTVTGAGKSNSIIDYSFTDDNPYSGTSYYRLKQTDFDSKFEYSAIKSVTVEASTEDIKVYPSITTGIVNIEGNKNELNNLAIYNAVGADVTQNSSVINSTDFTLRLDMSSLQSGIYFIKTTTVTKKVYKK